MLPWLPVVVLILSAVVVTARTALAGQGNTADTAVSCSLVLPPDPLTPVGLATPYRLQPPCHEGDSGTSAFVQGVVFDPATGQISTYNPLVVDEGTRPSVTPTAPKLPSGAVVALWFGFNGDNLTLQDAAHQAVPATCVNGLRGSIFGQFAFCNAVAFFAAVNRGIVAGKLTVPSPGTANDGKPCPSVRDFGLVDMDQSDNVTTTYLILPDGTTAQNTAANRTALATKGAHMQANGSDNALLTAFLFPALGCKPYTAPDLADPGHQATALALNELQAAAHQAAPVALVPTSDPMTLVDGKTSSTKTNLYRGGVDQPAVDRAADSPTGYCGDLVNVGTTRTKLDRDLTRTAPSPDPEAANSLFTFLARRLSGSFDALGCAQLLHLRNPVTVITNGQDVAIDARFAPVPVNPPSASPTLPSRPKPSASPKPSRSATRTASPSVLPKTPTDPAARTSTVAGLPIGGATRPAAGGLLTTTPAPPVNPALTTSAEAGSAINSGTIVTDVQVNAPDLPIARVPLKETTASPAADTSTPIRIGLGLLIAAAVTLLFFGIRVGLIRRRQRAFQIWRR